MTKYTPHIFFTLQDTDSLFMAHSSEYSSRDMLEYRNATKVQKPPEESHLAKKMADTYYRSFHHLLDTSSITPSSLLHKCFLKPNAFLNTLFRFTAEKRKAALFLYKDEISAPIFQVFATSPKQVPAPVRRSVRNTFFVQLMSVYPTCPSLSFCNSSFF